jgi:streptogramin lyase
VATAVALSSRGAIAAVDPSNLVSTGNIVVGSGQESGQTVVMRLAGRLTGIEIAPLLDTAGPSDLVSVEVFDGLSQSLGSVSISAAGFPPGAGVPAPLTLGAVGPGFFDLTPLAVDVSESETLSFVLSTTSSGVVRAGISGDLYPDGTLLVNVSPSASLDLAFKIFLTPIPKLLVGAANGPRIKAYDGATGAALGDFTTGAPNMLGANSVAIGGPLGNLFVGGWSTSRVDEFDIVTGAFVRTLASSGVRSTSRITFGPDGHLYLTDSSSGISRWNVSTGTLIGSFVSAGSGGLESIGGLHFGPDGHLYVSSLNFSTDVHEVLRYDGTTGAFLGVFVSNGSGGLEGPDGLVFGPDGDLYVSSRSTDNVLRFDGTTGAFSAVFASGGGLDVPYGLVFGPDDNLYVVAQGPDEVLRYDGTSGDFIDVFATGTNVNPTYLVFTEGELPFNTPVGTDVNVDLGSGVQVTFDTVTSVGDTTLTATPTNPGPPLLFGGRSDFYDIATTAGFTGQIEACLPYDDTGLTTQEEADIQVQRLVAGAWVFEPDVTSRDTVADVICVRVGALTPMVVVYDPPFDGAAVFSADFESGLGGFVLAGAGLWNLTTACRSPELGHSRATSLFYGNAVSCDYDTGATQGTATSPEILVREGAELRFAYLLQTEAARPGFDQATVLVSVNGGAFQTVASNDGGGPELQLADVGVWTTAEVDLTSLLPKGTSRIQVRFEFDTVDAAQNTFDGFYVDDVEVATQLAPVSLETFASGLGGFTIDNTTGSGNGLWKISTACDSTAPGHSVPENLFYGVEATCNYDTGFPHGGTVTSPAIDVVDAAEIAFNYSIETEGGSTFDLVTVSVSIDSGPFQPVAENSSAFGVVLADPSGGFQAAAIDLTSLLPGGSSTVQVRFQFETLDEILNQFAGVYIDDVAISTSPAIASTDPGGDPDADSIDNATELALGTDPFNADTDADGYCDGPTSAGGACLPGDNCPTVANGVGQGDQVNSDAFPAGDACQCGNIDGAGGIDAADLDRAREIVVGRSPAATSTELSFCDVDADQVCGVGDLFRLDRAVRGLPTQIEDACEGYLNPGGP